VAPPIVHHVLRSAGAPLPDGVCREMEQRFGHDFADIRIHADARAGESARAVEARAYTVGRQVVFAPGEFNPRSGTGQRLLVHELTHAAANPPDRQVPPGDLHVSSPDDAEERQAVLASQATQTHPAAPISGAVSLMRQQAPVDLASLGVNHSRVTVPPEAGLAFSAKLTPANPTGVTLTIAGVGGTTIDAGTTITNAGVITVAATQTGGAAQVEARQAYTAPDGSKVSTTSPSTAPFNFVGIPGAVTGATVTAANTADAYGGAFTQTFAPPSGSATRAIERAHVNERFASATGTKLALTGAMGSVKIDVNDPASPKGGWDLDAAARIVAPDHVTWSPHAGFTARPFVANASNRTPVSTLPQALNATQGFHNLSFPSRTYSSTPVATTTHRRALEERQGTLNAVTSALATGATTPEVVEDYMGPPVFSDCVAVPASVPPSAPRGRGAPPPNTSSVQVDRQGATKPPTSFSIQGPALGCTINARSGRVIIGSTAGAITVRGGDAASTNYDETTITIANPTPAAPTPTPGIPSPESPTPGAPPPGGSTP
jgi:hypothetical protein